MENFYLGHNAAVLEIRIQRVLELIGDDNRTRVHFESELRNCHTDLQKLTYCKNFALYLDNHRAWAQKNLWFVRPTVG